MVRRSSFNSDLFEDYVHKLFCEEYYGGGTPSRSLEVLSEMTGKQPKSGLREDRHSDILTMLSDLSPKQKEMVSLVEKAAAGFYSINRDTEDEAYIEAIFAKLEIVLSYIKPNSDQNIKTRNTIFNRMYDLDEQLCPNSGQKRFELLKRMVKDIKHNDGSYDYDPLNTSARRVQYFFGHISAKQRLQLLLEIQKKTIDSEKYNYTSFIESLSKAYQLERTQERENQRLNNQDRYDQIRTEELPKAQNANEKITLYKELMELVNDQDWSRQRKFSEKRSICNCLIELYQLTGDKKAQRETGELRKKYIDAGDRCIEAARKKGYYNR